MRTKWEKIVHHVRTIHGHGISNKLLNKNTVTIVKLEHPQDALDENQLANERRDHQYEHLSEARQFQKRVYE